ncbi:carbamoyl-phosphate synthase small subunit [Halanaerobium sp. DL-01]|uniref:glutamine amidotransferase-related protein n=1 Tax=Halanaerobium sp. DL-01 TaxID=1653064 RepID=UPI000DF32D7B|nr:carbamoyl-phosphate synthase domain-containing protein [Halanaerobium sp. DL-01]RCW78656.1 carbamoyl-phosphate synthase small subunit [Halanaerobium sp. DL-01]
MKKARLVLEDGSIFKGSIFGAENEAAGEVVFNTSMTGYQEILTDPSYKGEIVCMTYPLFGICLGHQLLGKACGAKTFRLKFGHRGANHPVKDLKTNKVYITSQNHGFALDDKSLSELDLNLTHVNVNDGTVEGIEHKKYPAFSVQYHPEASPGPEDSHYLFDQFMEMFD